MSVLSFTLAVGRRFQTWLKIRFCRSKIRTGSGLHIGKGTRLWAPIGIDFGRDVYIGKDVHIESNVDIGDYCLIASRVAFVGRHDHDFTHVGFPMRYAPWIGSRRFPSSYLYEQIVVGQDVWIGYGATVLTGVTIGRGSVIAAGSLVTRDIPPYSIAAGIPARVIGARFADSKTIHEHEEMIRTGRFNFSERGFDECTIEPGAAHTEGRE